MAVHLKPGLFDQYNNFGPAIIIAVSGGGDSMALLDIYRRARAQNSNLASPFVVTVDHGLRAGFGKEAALVEAYCNQFQLPWRLVCWETAKPKTGIMAAARIARYRLLADAAQDVGANLILTGHTLDDQNETLTMRAMRGTALPMESDVLFERRAWLSRPLLTVTRAALRAHLADFYIEFADDPTNVDLRFERSRVRKDARLADHRTEKAIVETDVMARAAVFIERKVRRDGNIIVVEKPNERDPNKRDYDAELLALRYLAAVLGGFDYPATVATGSRILMLLGDGPNAVSFTAQRSQFMRVEHEVRIRPDPRHASRNWLEPTVQPFEAFCALSKIPLANALAELVGAPPFLSNLAAAI